MSTPAKQVVPAASFASNRFYVMMRAADQADFQRRFSPEMLSLITTRALEADLTAAQAAALGDELERHGEPCPDVIGGGFEQDPSEVIRMGLGVGGALAAWFFGLFGLLSMLVGVMGFGRWVGLVLLPLSFLFLFPALAGAVFWAGRPGMPRRALGFPQVFYGLVVPLLRQLPVALGPDATLRLEVHPAWHFEPPQRSGMGWREEIEFGGEPWIRVEGSPASGGAFSLSVLDHVTVRRGEASADERARMEGNQDVYEGRRLQQLVIRRVLPPGATPPPCDDLEGPGFERSLEVTPEGQVLKVEVRRESGGRTVTVMPGTPQGDLTLSDVFRALEVVFPPGL